MTVQLLVRLQAADRELHGNGFGLRANAALLQDSAQVSTLLVNQQVSVCRLVRFGLKVSRQNPQDAHVLIELQLHNFET